MWPLINHCSELVTVHVAPQQFTLAWFSAPHNDVIPLNAFFTIPLHNLEYLDGLLFNPTQLTMHINHFIATNKLTNPTFAYAFTSPQEQEKIVTLATASPREHDFTHVLKDALLWDYIYLHPNDGSFTYYVCGITRKQLAQHTAFVCTNKHTATMITSTTAALLALYRHTHNTGFRYSQLAADLSASNGSIETLNAPHKIAPLVRSKTPTTHTDIEKIMPGLGMAYTFFKEQK